MFVMDSDTYTHYLRDHPQVVKRIEKAVVEKQPFGICVITLIEVLQGRFDSLLKADTHERFLKAQDNVFRAQQSLQRIRTLRLDETALEIFDDLSKLRGAKNIGRKDLLIASITRAHKATLVTRNLKHFKLIPQLKCENWVD
jgi:tRNA(fMet)-specific endonuclease VapC